MERAYQPQCASTRFALFAVIAQPRLAPKRLIPWAETRCKFRHYDAR